MFAKKFNLKTEDNVPLVSCKKKFGKNIFFCILMKLVESGADPDLLVRGTDPGIRIPTKMLWIPNTAILLSKYSTFY